MKAAARAVILSLLAAAVVLTVLVARRVEIPREYTNSILEKRRQTDLFMRQSPDSPIPLRQRSSFQGLSYFPPDPTYRVKARLVPIEGQEEIVVPTSDGSLRRYLRYAWAEFDICSSAGHIRCDCYVASHLASAVGVLVASLGNNGSLSFVVLCV